MGAPDWTDLQPLAQGRVTVGGTREREQVGVARKRSEGVLAGRRAED